MYDNPYMNHLQYNHYPDMSQSDMMSSYNNVPDNNQASNNYMQQTFSGVSSDQMAQYSNGFISTIGETQRNPNNTSYVNPVASPKTLTIDPKAPTQEQIQNKQDAAVIGGAVNAGISAIPVYGQIIGAATGVSNIGRSFLKKDEYGEVKGKFGKMLDAGMTPVHQQAIDDATAGDWGGAALDILTAGSYKVIKEWAK